LKILAGVNYAPLYMLAARRDREAIEHNWKDEHIQTYIGGI